MNLKIGIAGATGVVAEELIPLLAQRDVPVSDLRLFASEKSEGRGIETPYGEKIIQLLSEKSIEGLDVIFFSASAEVSREWCPYAASKGILCIDKSSAFRNDSDIPLIVPEVNGETIGYNLIISSPNCTTTLAAVVLWPIHKVLGLRRVIVSTYQAASGAGRPAMEELRQATEARIFGKEFFPKEFPHNLDSNLFPCIGDLTSNGYTDEEMKFTNELRRIFEMPDLPVSCTSARVPIGCAHSESITVETFYPFIRERVQELLKNAPGVELADDLQNGIYPMPSRVEGRENVQVGRIRQSLVFGDHGGDLFLSGDQLLKGAALNALQILEYIIKQRSKK